MMATVTTNAQLSALPRTAQPNLFLRIVRAIDPRALILYAILLAASLFFLFPMAWMAGTSLKTIEEVGQPQLNLLPANPQWDNYAKLLREETFYRAYTNSVFVVTLVLVGTVTSIALVAYTFSRLEWKGRGIVFALMMGTLMLPAQATLVPQYVLFHNLGWIRTFNPITIPGFFAGGAALVFLVRQFMLSIPRELDEAAMIDGANPLQIWWYVIMPLSRPAIATITVFLFVGQWNNLINPLIYLQRAELFTMPIYVAQKNNLQESPIPWQDIMAASVLFVIPVLVVFILTQRYFVEGITMTGTKG
ncbi:MAG: carbohydrate ABC transporter permease [Chloroflexi bacterium]|nr:carbohydrate ABC transporter permease [Chloroflexota bacterium]